MKIQYDFFKRKIELKFMLGVYPEYKFHWKGKRYCIRADLEKYYTDTIEPSAHLMKEEDMVADFYPAWDEIAYFMGDYIQIGEFSSIDELFKKGCIENTRIEDAWNDFDFIELDEDYAYYYETYDGVFVKDKGIYGVVERIEDKKGKVVFWVLPEENFDDGITVDENKLIPCDADRLEYDVRPDTIKAVKESYADYLYRLSH